MRRWNAVISALIMVLMLVHGVIGGYQMAGMMAGGLKWGTILSWIMLLLVVLHLLIGIKLTMDTITACKRSGVYYWKENKMFLIRRISGLAMILLIFYHMIILGGTNGQRYRLHLFEGIQLTGSLLFVLILAVHILSNIKSLFMGFGAKGLQKYRIDILFVMSIILLFCAIAFVIYYFRWNIWW